MSLQQKADLNEGRERAQEAWSLWIRDMPVNDVREGVIEVYVQAFFAGAQYGREQERAAILQAD